VIPGGLPQLSVPGASSLVLLLAVRRRHPMPGLHYPANFHHPSGGKVFGLAASTRMATATRAARCSVTAIRLPR
jgi:hypothetical protein